MNRQLPHVVLCAWILVIAGLTATLPVRATDLPPEPLHARIDRLIEASPSFVPVAPSSDSEFLRRVSIDLTGMPPSLTSLRKFVADKAADKRARIVDELLESPLFVRQWVTFLDITLMERRAHVNVPADAWYNHLLAAARANRPLDQIIRELLVADGRDPKQRPASRFYLDRAGDPDLITRDVGRIFLGRDLQCAQCHNHPLVKDYQQSDYKGLLAFFAPGYAFPSTPTPTDTVVFPEKAATDLTFDSVFVKGDKHVTGPRVPGEPELDEPTFPPGDEYLVKPTDKTLPVPKYSRRVRLASVMTGGANQAFNENIANRLWAFMMGRGIVHPLDLNHPSNPPTHPELLRLLGREVAELHFDAKPFLRQLALTRTYQRSIDLPETLSKLLADAATNLNQLKSQSNALEERAEQARSVYQSSVKAWHKAEDLLVPLVAESEKALAAHAEVSKKAADAQLAVTAATSKLETGRKVAKAFTEAAARAQEAAALVPQEKELLAAAQKFKVRATAATTEIPTLEKTIVAANATLTDLQKQITKSLQHVSATRDKLNPVRETVRKAEQWVIAKRTTMGETRSAAELHARRIGLLEACVARKSIEDQLASAARTVAAKRPALAKARELSAEAANRLRQVELEISKANSLVAAARKARTDGLKAVERHQQLYKLLESAATNSQTAARQLPDDSSLAEAVQTLRAKSLELQSLLPQLTTELAGATSTHQKASDALAKLDENRRVILAEKSRHDATASETIAAIAVETERSKSLQTELATTNDHLATLLGHQFTLAQLKPLTPEQMCWSLLAVTGVYDVTRSAEEAALAKSKPLTTTAAADPALLRKRSIEIEQRTFDKLKGNLSAFVNVYSAGAGQPQNDFFATPDQALFTANGGSVTAWVVPTPGNLSHRLLRQPDPHAVAEDLYMTVLSRSPTSEESAEVARILQVSSKDKTAAVQELVWGLLASAEFRFNH